MTPEFIAEMAWKSAAISSVALLALVLLRSRSATDRAALVRLAVVMLLLLPIISLGLPALKIERPAQSVEATPIIAATATGPQFVKVVEEGSAVTPMPVTPELEIPTALLLTLGYLTGVVLLSVRLAVGLWTLRRWTAEAVPVATSTWTGALRCATARAGFDGPVRLLASDDVSSPLSWGLRRPVILVDRATLDRPADADAVLAHELAHVQRRDWMMLMLSRLAVALFWFNPLVWLLERALIEQAEEAADLAAVSDVEPVTYVRTLVACGAQAGGFMLPANSIADGSGLARRVKVILDEERRRLPSGSAWTRMAMLFCAAVSAPIAALELVPPKPPVPTVAPMAPAVPRAPLALTSPTAPAVPSAPKAALPPVAPAAPEAPMAPTAPAAPGGLDLAEIDATIERAASEAASAVRLAAVDNAVARAAEASRTAAEARTVALVQTRAAGRAIAAIDVDDLIAMRTHGIDDAYLAQVVALAPRFRPSVDELVRMKIHGMTPARIREFAELGYLDVDDLVSMQIQGVTPAYARAIAAAGYRGLAAEDLVTMRIHGVTPEQAQHARIGDRRPNAEELVKMRIHGLL